MSGIVKASCYSLGKGAYGLVQEWQDDDERENWYDVFTNCTVSVITQLAQRAGEQHLDAFERLCAELKVSRPKSDVKKEELQALLEEMHADESKEPIETLEVVDGGEGAKASVVDDRYREKYKKVSKGGVHCGDWLAMELEGVFVTRVEGSKRDSFDADGFTELLEFNGVDMTGPWAKLPTSGQKGWVGRYRMNGRQKLEQVVLRTGKLLIKVGDKTVTEVPPIDWLNAMLRKYPSIKGIEWQEGDKGEVEYLS